MSQRGYLRQPTIRHDTIVFICDDDLWGVPASGGTARRLTAGLGEAATPVLSPDGRWIAFVGRDEQHPEVYVMPSAGGPARRITWLGPDVLVRGWTSDDRILFVSTYGQPFFRNYRAFAIGLGGGLPEVLPYGQVNHLAFGPGNAKVIGRNTADPARWKRYRGGTAGHLWVDSEGNGNFKRLEKVTGNVTSPMFVGERIYYLSDAEGVGNLYSCRPDGSERRRHTDHDVYYARHAQTDGRQIVYQCGAEIWLFDPRSNRTQCVVVETPSHRTQAARKFVPAPDYLGGFQAHPAGHSVAVEARGKLFSFALWEGAVLQHGTQDGVRYRHGHWLADGAKLVAVSDETGEERVQVFDGVATNTLDWDVGRVLSMRASPKAARVAITNHRNELLIGDLEGDTLTIADRSTTGRIEDLAWSPDGEWLAYSTSTTPRHRSIKLLEVATQTTTLVTRPEFRDYSPSFDPEGKYLYFLSVRTFDPVYDEVQFELSFPRAARPYLVALQADQRPPFDALPKGLQFEDPSEKRHERQKPRAIRVDLAGIERRIAAFPVAEGRFGQIAGVVGGKVVWTVLPIVGAHGRGGHKDTQGKLEIFDFATLKAETLQEKADQFVVAEDRTTIVLREGKRLRAIAAEKRHDKEEDSHSDAPSRKTGWLDLNRIRLSVEPTREWKQMLREVWRLQRDQFWVPDMSGVDWDAILKTYEPLVERVATRGELSDLIWEMQGELGTSHAYEMGGDYRRAPSMALGYLAADLSLDADGEGYEIQRIVEGDSWDADADSPLNAVGVQAKVGERIVAVNGQHVSRTLPPQALLVHQAGMKAELELAPARGADSKSGRSVLIKALGDEVPARYREWVERNRRWIHEESKNRVGYLHLPDMMSAGFAEFHRYFTAECDRDALIVDVRYNRGGHVSQLLLEKVARRRIGYDYQRWGEPMPYPAESPLGPVVALTNEHSGSDGDIFSHCFKLMGIGKLVGTRTWGGVIGIWPRHSLVDGTETTQPEFSFWFNDVGWGVENYGTDPDIEIDNAPQDTTAGRDRQLEVALETAFRAIETTRPSSPRFGPRPQLARQPLPPRTTE